MKIAVVYSSNIAAAWCLSDGIVHTLRRMGHQVLDMPQSGYRRDAIDWWTRVDEINQADLFILSGVDYAYWQRSYSGYRTTYCVPNIAQTMEQITTRTCAIYFENKEMYRDRSHDYWWLRDCFDHNFYPAIQDVDYLNWDNTNRCHWFPFSADTDIFYPQRLERPHELGFIGHIYPQRERFLEEYYGLIPDSGWIPVMGHATVEDVEGINIPESTRRLAYNYNRIKTLVVLPTMSQEVVTKVYEAMACGCCVLVPDLIGTEREDPRSNFIGLEHERDIFIYEPTPAGLAKAIGTLKANPELIDKLGFNAVITTLRTNTLRQRMEFLLGTVGL